MSAKKKSAGKGKRMKVFQHDPGVYRIFQRGLICGYLDNSSSLVEDWYLASRGDARFQGPGPSSAMLDIRYVYIGTATTPAIVERYMQQGYAHVQTVCTSPVPPPSSTGPYGMPTAPLAWAEPGVYTLWQAGIVVGSLIVEPLRMGSSTLFARQHWSLQPTYVKPSPAHPDVTTTFQWVHAYTGPVSIDPAVSYIQGNESYPIPADATPSLGIQELLAKR